MTDNLNKNPLSSFGRHPKLELNLPSEGKWYPDGSLELNANNTVSVRSMTGSDDLKFKAGDASMGGSNVLNLIASCIPNIKKVQDIPSIDLDALLLAIRWASYGQILKQTIQVPNTTITKTIQVDLEKVLGKLSSSSQSWDETLTITSDDNTTLIILVKPINVSTLFSKTQQIQEQKESIIKNSSVSKSLDAPSFNVAVNQLSNVAIELIASSIESLILPDGTKISDQPSILKIIQDLDVSYFNAIRDHITSQRENFIIKSEWQISTTEEIKAGAPEKWQGELIFAGTNFFTDNK